MSDFLFLSAAEPLAAQVAGELAENATQTKSVIEKFFDTFSFAKLVSAAILLVICIVCIKILLKATEKMLKSSKLDRSCHTFIRSTVKIVLVFLAIMLLAGMQSVSTDLYEAADIDGATTFQKIRYITIPAIRSVSTTVFLLLIIWTIKDYAIAYVLTKGGPSRATELLTIYIQQTGFKYFDFGKASAAGMLMLLVALAFTFFYFKVLNKEEE